MTTVRRLTKQAIKYLSQPKKEARDGHSQTPSPLFEGELEESMQATSDKLQLEERTQVWKCKTPPTTNDVIVTYQAQLMIA
jgi:DNA-binding GntR family transcriptional regulator